MSRSNTHIAIQKVQRFLKSLKKRIDWNSDVTDYWLQLFGCDAPSLQEEYSKLCKDQSVRSCKSHKVSWLYNQQIVDYILSENFNLFLIGYELLKQQNVIKDES